MTPVDIAAARKVQAETLVAVEAYERLCYGEPGEDDAATMVAAGATQLAVIVLRMADEIERLRKIEEVAWDLSSQVYPTEEQRAALYFALRKDLPK